MFVASLAFSMLAAEPTPTQPAIKTCPEGWVIHANETCPTLPDHRLLYSLRPEVLTDTVEWSCKQRSVRAQIRTVEQPHTNERGERIAKHKFKVQLVSLQLDGAPASPESIARVREALAPLNTVIQLYGMCFVNGVPELNVVGHSLSDPPREQRRTRIELK